MRSRPSTASLDQRNRDIGRIEYGFRTVHGETIPAELRFTSLPGAEDGAARVGVIRDITESAGIDIHGSPLSLAVGSLAGGDGFYLKDDGVGIPADEQDCVFEGGYSTDTDGTGFGLTIVREVANAHGWSITATTGDSGGARFEVTGVSVVSVE